VLRQLGVFDAMRPNMMAVRNFVFCDQTGNPLLELPSSTDDKNLNLRVKRSSLKDGLRGAAPDVPIHYGTECIRYRQTAAGVYDGRTIQAEYVVAADGVGSAMRQQLVGDRKRYLGLSCVVGSARTEVDHPLLVGGYFMMLGDSGDSVFCYRDENGLHVSYTAHVESEDVLKAQSSEELVKLVQKATAGWSAPVPQIAAALDPSTIVVHGYYDKEPLKHVRDGRVWLLGDAAHPMSPFQGQGANMAMLDAWKLAQLLASDGCRVGCRCSGGGHCWPWAQGHIGVTKRGQAVPHAESHPADESQLRLQDGECIHQAVCAEGGGHGWVSPGGLNR
jgi:2-polyprenyl-6-methoxyphenol hydroxylase-like FAD-dependent oxidoreductase